MKNFFVLSILFLIFIFSSKILYSKDLRCISDAISVSDKITNSEGKYNRGHINFELKHDEKNKNNFFIEFYISLDEKKSIKLKSINFLSDDFYIFDTILRLTSLFPYTKILISDLIDLQINLLYEKTNESNKIIRNFDDYTKFLKSDEFSFQTFKNNFKKLSPYMNIKFIEDSLYKSSFDFMKNTSHEELLKSLSEAPIAQIKDNKNIDEINIISENEINILIDLYNEGLKNNNFTIKFYKELDDSILFKSLLPLGSFEAILKPNMPHKDITTGAEFVLSDPNTVDTPLPELYVRFYKYPKRGIFVKDAIEFALYLDSTLKGTALFDHTSMLVKDNILWLRELGFYGACVEE